LRREAPQRALQGRAQSREVAAPSRAEAALREQGSEGGNKSHQWEATNLPNT
jgi:hypothetical protein